MRLWAVRLRNALAAVLSALACKAAGELSLGKGGLVAPEPRHFLTNVVQFRELSRKDYLGGCAFHLEGVVTLVDPNRNLLVLQDGTAAVALHFEFQSGLVEVGQAVSIEGTNCYPYIVAFPAYPYRPSGWDIRQSFEAPSDWGDYYLTRMRGFLHPPVSGAYTFWIASDNSSELWLSTDADPSNTRKIAFIPQFGWVAPREWSKYPSQHSESIWLEAGQIYYLEALQEQTTAANNLAVAWQGPSLEQSVIPEQYLTPWIQWHGTTPPEGTNGILREYWTNYSSGNLAVLNVPTVFRSALSVERVRVSLRGRVRLPRAFPISLTQRLPEEDNYHWVAAMGRVKFAGTDGASASLELSDGQSDVEVRVLNCAPGLGDRVRDSYVRVEGVCEGVYTRNGVLVPGLIWASAENSISLVQPENMDLLPTDLGQASSRATTSTNPPMTGFYGTRGVVTFNDRVFDKEYLYVQEDSASVLVSLQDRHFKNEFKAGQCLELGGALLPGRAVPVIHPLAVTELGWRAMPMPVSQPAQLPIPESSEGKWTEVEGVAHRVQANDTLAVMGKAGPISVWIGQAASNYLGRYVDARLRVRGVLTLPAPDAPLLLVPSRSFVDVEEEARTDPFAIPVHAIRDLTPATLDPSSLHRIRLVGEVTYRNGLSLVIQDESGGAWVQSLDEPPVKIGDAVEVVGFPAAGGGFLTVTEALVRPSNARRHVEPAKLDLSEALSSKQSGKLVRVTASLLIQKTVGFHQILEVQEQRRVFAAMLSRDNGTLPTIAPGSRVTITGVCDNGGVALRASGQLGGESLPLGSLRVLLRGPGDVAVLSGPPWWTLKRTLTLVGALLTVLAVALLWVQLLRRRLARQHTARLAFSRQILQGQESERQRIALNLHDSLGQNLLVIKHQARLAMDPTTDASERQKRLNDISEITSQALEEVRQITHDLRPYQLDRLGLTQAIRATVSRAAESSSIQFASHVDDIDALFNKEAEIHLYRVIQEAVNNILKHSSATEAAVVVKNQTARVSVSVRDNGCGFDPPAADFAHSRNVGYGLKGMTERVRILGGSLLINSGPARGTSLTVELPKPSVR